MVSEQLYNTRPCLDFGVVSLMWLGGSAVEPRCLRGTTPGWSMAVPKSFKNERSRCFNSYSSVKSEAVLRLIYSSNRNEHAIPPFIDANIPPLTFSYYESIANLMYDVRHGISTKSIQALFEYVSSIHQYNTWSSESHNLYIKRSILANSFSRIGAKLWNEIPLSLRNL